MILLLFVELKRFAVASERDLNVTVDDCPQWRHTAVAKFTGAFRRDIAALEVKAFKMSTLFC